MRPSLLSFSAIGACWILAACGLAQRMPSSDFRKLTQDEARVFLAEFRSSHLKSDLCLRFEVTHKPRTGKTAPPIQGTLWANSSLGEQILRGELFDTSGKLTLSFLTIKNATQSRVWVYTEGSPTKEIDAQSSLAPLAPGLLFSPFDLQLPFTHWAATEYMTTERRRRPAHIYSATNQTGQSPFKVTYAIDRVYHVLVEAVCFNAENIKSRTLQVEEFSKVGEQWMLAACSIRDEASRDVDTLRIIEAALDAKIPDEVFDPKTLHRAAPQPAHFEKL